MRKQTHERLTRACDKMKCNSNVDKRAKQTMKYIVSLIDVDGHDEDMSKFKRVVSYMINFYQYSEISKNIDDTIIISKACEQARCQLIDIYASLKKIKFYNYNPNLIKFY